ncbi:Reverse transcriptase [Phytophthora palmivora]|uniref:Reverse transcriptase n=1 Tax=Phytophthora palmivora TaxID=4796 RepID=A0A2P4X000_9STRA|nr:Reverse transcriptase [Phytophthora palmivora]
MRNRLVTQLARPLRSFTQTYFDDIFVHSRVEDGQTAMEVRLKHLHLVFEAMIANMVYPNINKVGVCADPGKVKAIGAWPTLRSQKNPRKLLDLTNNLRKYSAGYAELARPLSDLLKKECRLVLVQPDETKSFSEEGRERIISIQSRQLILLNEIIPFMTRNVLQ